jgi:hypothetical protein
VDASCTDRLAFTTDISRGAVVYGRTVAVLIFALAAFMIVGPVLTWSQAPANRIGDLANIVVCGAMGAGFAWMAFYLWVYCGPSSWEIDRLGIAVEDTRGRRRSLFWQDVKRVRWNGMGVRLLGLGERIELGWREVPGGSEDVDATRALLRRYLRPHIDLPNEPAEPAEPEPLSMFAFRLVTRGIFIFIIFYRNKTASIWLLKIGRAHV